MSYLRWKKEPGGRKSLFIVSSPWVFFMVLLVLVPLLLGIVGFLKSLVR